MSLFILSFFIMVLFNKIGIEDSFETFIKFRVNFQNILNNSYIFKLPYFPSYEYFISWAYYLYFYVSIARVNCLYYKLLSNYQKLNKEYFTAFFLNFENLIYLKVFEGLFSDKLLSVVFFIEEVTILEESSVLIQLSVLDLLTITGVLIFLV